MFRYGILKSTLHTLTAALYSPIIPFLGLLNVLNTVLNEILNAGHFLTGRHRKSVGAASPEILLFADRIIDLKPNNLMILEYRRLLPFASAMVEFGLMSKTWHASCNRVVLTETSYFPLNGIFFML
jgi:hypothetical protein